MEIKNNREALQALLGILDKLEGHKSERVKENVKVIGESYENDMKNILQLDFELAEIVWFGVYEQIKSKCKIYETIYMLTALAALKGHKEYQDKRKLLAEFLDNKDHHLFALDNFHKDHEEHKKTCDNHKDNNE